MVKPQPLPFATYVSDELQKLCQEKRTGTLSVVTANNLLAQFGLNQGEIVALSVQNKQGLEGLEILELLGTQEIKVGTSRFTEGRLGACRSALPPTAHILGVIQGKSLPAQTEPRSERMTDRARVIVEEELVEFLGPMAIIVCEEVWREARGLDDALDALIRELPDLAQAARFRQNALKRLAQEVSGAGA